MIHSQVGVHKGPRSHDKLSSSGLYRVRNDKFSSRGPYRMPNDVFSCNDAAFVIINPFFLIARAAHEGASIHITRFCFATRLSHLRHSSSRFMMIIWSDRTDGGTNGWTEGRMEGRRDGWMDG